MMKLKLYYSLFCLPAPKNISYYWNIGSLLMICSIMQIITGLLLSMSFSPYALIAFSSIMKMTTDNLFLSLMQISHANGSSFFFICIYIHIGRNIYYQSYKLIFTWITGVMLFFFVMITAFLGYVLPWGQMSFWGAMVITNLLSTIPYLGNILVTWLWGGFSVDISTLNRFFVFHFLLPFIIVIFIMIHLLNLHKTGSSNPLGMKSNLNKISFLPFFIYKDILGFLILFFILSVMILYFPFKLGDPDNFSSSNPMSTPIHIQPEWYFLFMYAILRSIPNKLGGTIALMFSIMILFFIPFFSFNNFKGNKFYLINKFLFWLLMIVVFLLTWIGMSPMIYPFIMIGQFLTLVYFSLYILNQYFMNKWDKLIN